MTEYRKRVEPEKVKKNQEGDRRWCRGEESGEEGSEANVSHQSITQVRC